MGSSPECLRFLLHQLSHHPHDISWSAPRSVVLLRGENRKLGFHFKTFSYPESSETVTLVFKVKEDCRIKCGSVQEGDRIVSVGNVPVTCLHEAQVKDILSCSQEPAVRLQVTSQFKRIHSVNSGTSGGSVTASVDSVERPQVKIVKRSSSIETPPRTSPSTDLAPRATGASARVVADTLPSRRLQACAPPRECASRTRPGHPPQHPSPRLAPHLHHHHPQHCHSLPDRMEDDVVRSDDIVLNCEPDGTNSLPPVLTPLPNTPTPPSPLQHPAFVNTVSTGIGGESVVAGGGSSSSSSSAQHRSLGVEVCRSPGCNSQKLCLWHKFVYMHPQYVIWEPFTKTVVLEKHDSSSSFGFRYKVKRYDGPPVEDYALVTEVISGGVAWNLLLSGDWIRSMNGTPFNTAKEAYSPDFWSMSSLRLVIQRPEGLSWKGLSKLQVMALNMGVKLHIPVSVPSESASPPRVPPRSDSARLAADHKSKYLDRHVAAGVEEGCRFGAREPNCHHGALFDPLLDQYPRQTQSPGEHILLNTLSRPARCAFPQARVVVCGAHGSAVDFVRGLVGGDGAGISIDPDAPVQNFRLSLPLDGDLAPSQRRLSVLIKEWESLACRAGECGREGMRCMNVELHVVSDEQFFLHCLPWLLPACTLVIFTFHVHKLLNQPQLETRRLAAMVHSMQACMDAHASPPTSNILLYGLPSGSQRDVSADEVQGMFYVTDSGSRLLERYGLAVNVCRSMAETRQVLFTACQRRLLQTTVAQCVARVVDTLSALPAVRVAGGEVSGMVTRVVGEGDPGMVQSVVSSLVDLGCLLPCGSSRPGREAEQQDYLLPFNTVLALSSLLVKPLLDTHTIDSRQKWFKLITTARLSRSELAELLASEGSSLSLDMLEQLGVVFRLSSSPAGGRGDSGFAEDAAGDFVLPYFLQDSDEEGVSDLPGFVLRFEQHLSWRGYFNMLCKLSTQPATEEVSVQSQCHAVVRHDGLRLSLRWRKDSGCESIFVAVSRCPRSREGVVLQDLERLFRFVIPPAVPFKVQVADDTSPSSNLPSRGGLQSVLAPPRPAAALPEETFVKPVVEVGEASGPMEEDYRDVPLTDLPWSVITQVAILLSVPMPTGHDWKNVAEQAGKSVMDICAYEAISAGGREVPAMTFLREWILTGRVQQFLDILETLDREDVRTVILDHLRDRN